MKLTLWVAVRAKEQNATGWSEPVPGREFHPLKSSAFHGALYHQRILFDIRTGHLGVSAGCVAHQFKPHFQDRTCLKSLPDRCLHNGGPLVR